jgi:hypothetical protein
VVSFLKVSPAKSCMSFYSPPYVPRGSWYHPRCFDHPNNILWGLQIFNFHITYFLYSPAFQSPAYT